MIYLDTKAEEKGAVNEEQEPEVQEYKSGVQIEGRSKRVITKPSYLGDYVYEKEKERRLTWNGRLLN